MLFLLCGCSNYHYFDEERTAVQRNDALGITLPVNVDTDWEVVEKNNAKYVVYYSSPYKRDTPYKEAISPDIEKVIDIDNYEEMYSNENDCFQGLWFGGLNDFEHLSYDYIKNAEKVNRNIPQVIEALQIYKDKDTGEYSIVPITYIFPAASEEKIAEWQRMKLGDPISVAMNIGNSHRGAIGYDEYISGLFSDNDTIIKTDGDKMYVHVEYIYSRELNYADLEFQYHQSNDSLEITKMDFHGEHIKNNYAIS